MESVYRTILKSPLFRRVAIVATVLWALSGNTARAQVQRTLLLGSGWDREMCSITGVFLGPNERGEYTRPSMKAGDIGFMISAEVPSDIFVYEVDANREDLLRFYPPQQPRTVSVVNSPDASYVDGFILCREKGNTGKQASRGDQ